MAKQAPNPIDIQDFQFKLHTRLKVFPSDHFNNFKKFHNILTSASRFGLVFVGSTSHFFKVIQISHVETLTQKENDEADYKYRTVHLPSHPTHLSVNCDSTKLAAVVEKNACFFAIIYDVSSFLKKDVLTIQEIRLSASPGVEVVESAWNPTLPNVFTACKSDGTLGVYEFKETGVDIHELPIESQATCMCWSPKGKQIAVGSSNGKITQYKPDLKAMKVINEPPLDGSYSVVAIQWISSFQFIAIYKCANVQFGSTLLVVDAPKTGEVTYTNYEDICYSNGNARPIQFYTIHEPLWNILIVASSNSMEVGVLGSEKEQWTQWILGDTARAELPLSSSKQDTLPIGLTLDKSAVEPIIFGEHSLPPAPFLFVLSDHGMLCCFRMINIKNGVSSICQAPETPSDISGLSSFVSSGSLKPQPVQVVTPSVTKPVQQPIPAQIPQSLLTPPKEIPRPPKEVPLHQTHTLASSASSSIFGTTSDTTINTVKSNNFTKTIHAKPEQSQTFSISPKVSHPNPSTTVGSSYSLESKIDQEEADILISKLIREECEVIEKELKILLHKGSSIKIDLGTDGEATNLIQDADAIQNFLKEVIETNTVQAAEVHSLKQGLIKIWAWYEDGRSRYMQSEDSTLNTLFRIQQLDPVSQRYMSDIEYLTYYLESQLNQAGRVLDEQWENFQDYCKKVSRLKIPTVETIYQTMVRQSAIHQKQKYVLKDISSRIQAQRRKVNGRSVFVSLNNLEQLEKDLLQLQLDPNNILCAQFERVLENQSKLTTSKIKKLEKMLSEREVTHVSVNKPQLSNASLQTVLNNSSAKLRRSDETILGAALSPISVGKTTSTKPRIIDFVQSTPHTAVTIPARIEKLKSDFEKPQSIKSDPIPTFNPSVPKTEEDKAGFDFTVNAKKTFTFGPQQNANASENQNKFPQINTIFKSKTETTISFATVTSPATSTTSAITSQKSQFSFGPVTTSSFTSLFGTTKPDSSTKFNPPISNTTGAEGTKSISGTESSAFVPTTQLAFTFTAKSTPTITPSPTNLTIKSSTTAFNFGAASTDTPQTPTLIKSDPFSSAVSKNTTPSVTSLSTLLSESTSSTPTLFKATITTSNTVTTTVSSTKTVPVDLTTSTSSAQSQFANLFSSFSFSNADTQSNIFTPKTSTGQAQNVPQTLPTTSIFAPVTKTTSPSFFGSTSKPEFSFSGTISTPSKSLFSPVVTCESNTQSTVVEADSTSTAKLGSIFGAPISTSTTSILSNNIISGVTVNSTNTVTSANAAASIATITSPLLGTTSVFGTTNTNIFGNKTSAAATPTTTTIFGSITTPSSTPVIFGSTTITTTTPSSNIFGTGSNSSTTSAPSIFSSSTGNTVSVTTIAPTSSIFSGTTSSSIFGGVKPTTTSLFGVTTSTAPVQVQSPNTTTVATTTTSSTSPFGATSPIGSIFAALTTTTTSTPVYVLPPAFGTSSNFLGQPTTSAPTLSSTTKPNVFGETTKTATAPFASPTNAFENTSPVFGVASGFGTPASTSSSVFGSTNTSTTAFGSSGSLFGNASTANTGFSQTSTSSFSFSAAAANLPNSGFGKPPFGFGSSQGSSGDGGSFSFNTPTMGGSTTTPNTSFGQSTSTNPFAKSTSQEQKPAFGGGSLFGTPSSTTASIFGGGSSSVFGGSSTQQTAPAFGASPSFGTNTAFGQPPAFGQSAFGTSFSSPQQPAPFSGGGGQSVAQSGFGAFGQAQQKSSGFGAAPVFGGSPSGFGSPPSFTGGTPAFGSTSAFGTSNKLFGEPSNTTDGFTSPAQQSSTFANLANQNTIGFGALAQQSPTLPTAAPFQSSSFSTWR